MNALWMILIEGLIISAVGTLLHFVYDWSHQNRRVGVVAAVNESTWEHIKIAIFPMFAAMFVDGFWWSSEANYFIGKLASLVATIILILVLFYGYHVFIKKSILPIDIVIFYIAIFGGQTLFWRLTTLPGCGDFWSYLALDGIFALFATVLTMTLQPLKNFIFKDPITDNYGFRGHGKEIK